MQALEHKIPPPVVAALLAAAMWFVAPIAPHAPVGQSVRLALALPLALAGFAFDLAGLVAFYRSRTTINPMRPDRTSALVTGGVYRITRNPMYVGLALLLTAWAVALGALWPCVGPVAFVAYVGRFQIQPEERVLARRFGQSYIDYTARVRRWL